MAMREKIAGELWQTWDRAARKSRSGGKRGVLANHGASFMLGERWSELENRE